MLFRIAFILVCFCFGESSLYAEGQVQDAGGLGKYLEFIDGVVTCVVFDGFKSGAISCTTKLNSKGLKVEGSDTGYTFKTELGPIFRKKVGARLCYFYDTFEAGGVSCVPME